MLYHGMALSSQCTSTKPGAKSETAILLLSIYFLPPLLSPYIFPPIFIFLPFLPLFFRLRQTVCLPPIYHHHHHHQFIKNTCQTHMERCIFGLHGTCVTFLITFFILLFDELSLVGLTALD